MRKFIQNTLDLCLLTISVLLLESIFRLFVGFRIISPRGVLFTISSVVFVYSILYFFNDKYRRGLSIVFLAFLSVYSFSQIIYFRYFASLYSINKIVLLTELQSVTSEVLMEFDIKMLVIFVPLVLYVGSLYIFRKVKQYPIAKNKTSAFQLLFLIFFSLQILTMVTFAEGDWSQNDFYLYRTFYSRVRAMERFGVNKYVERDLQIYLGQLFRSTSQTDISSIDSYLESKDVELTSNEYTGIFKGKNLIYILAESLDELAINPEITPNLYRLKTEGLYFNNYYSPVYNASTADSEFVLNTSMFPSIDYGVAAYNYGNNTYPYTIANTFQKENYFTNSFHSFHSFFYNRENMHTSLGFSTFYDIEKLNLNYELDGWQEGIDWIDDVNLMRNMLNVSTQKDPFFSFVITVSGHLPYNAGRRGLMEYFNQLKEYEYLEPYTFYLSAQKKLDDSIGLLFEELENRGLLNDTVIVIASDHYPYGMDTESLKTYGFESGYDYEKYRVPLMIWSSNIEPKEIDTMVSSLDVVPTILNLYGLQQNKVYFGTDVFSENHREIVVLKDRSWATPSLYYDSQSNIITQLNESMSKIDYDEQVNQSNSFVYDLFNVGQKMLTTDYFRVKE